MLISNGLKGLSQPIHSASSDSLNKIVREIKDLSTKKLILNLEDSPLNAWNKVG